VQWSVVVVMAVVVVAVKEAAAGIPGNMGQDHMGFVVRNADEASRFFQEVFDCEFDWEVRRPPHPDAGVRGWDSWLHVNPRAHMPHVVMLKCGDHMLTQYIELFQWVDPDQVVPAGGWPRFSDIGFSYVSFTVKDIAAVWEHVRGLIRDVKYPGLRLVQDPPMVFPLRGELCSSAFMVTPWGMWIEVTQWSESARLASIIKPIRNALAGIVPDKIRKMYVRHMIYQEIRHASGTRAAN
jgi:3-hydroxy-D-aspartate aldolase